MYVCIYIYIYTHTHIHTATTTTTTTHTTTTTNNSNTNTTTNNNTRNNTTNNHNTIHVFRHTHTIASREGEAEPAGARPARWPTRTRGMLLSRSVAVCYVVVHTIAILLYDILRYKLHRAII